MGPTDFSVLFTILIVDAYQTCGEGVELRPDIGGQEFIAVGPGYRAQAQAVGEAPQAEEGGGEPIQQRAVGEHGGPSAVASSTDTN